MQISIMHVKSVERTDEFIRVIYDDGLGVADEVKFGLNGTVHYDSRRLDDAGVAAHDGGGLTKPFYTRRFEDRGEHGALLFQLTLFADAPEPLMLAGERYEDVQ